MRPLQSVDVKPPLQGSIVGQVKQADFARTKSAMIGQPEHGAIPGILDDGEQRIYLSDRKVLRGGVSFAPLHALINDGTAENAYTQRFKTARRCKQKVCLLNLETSFWSNRRFAGVWARSDQ